MHTQMNKRRGATVLATVVLAAGLSGCATPPAARHDSAGYYDASIVDAAVTSPEKIMALLPLPAEPTVKVISWVTEKRAPCQPGQAQCDLSVGTDRLWVTLDGEVRNLCRSWNLNGDPLRQRLEQLLGLPQDPPQQYRKVRFVVMEVARARIERACLGIDETDAAHPVCTLNEKPAQSAELRNFVAQQMVGSYVLRNPSGPGYPFTRLGYTYDWNPDTHVPNHYGASEFLIMPNTTAKVVAHMPTDEYCQPSAAK